MGAREYPPKQWRVRSAPAVCLRERGHVEDVEELATFVQNGNRAMRAGINSQHRRHRHALRRDKAPSSDGGDAGDAEWV
jgi:hypothetical protein